MVAIKFSALALAALAAAAPQQQQQPAAPRLPSPATDKSKSLEPSFKGLLPGISLTPQILATLIEPNAVNLARNTHVTRDGTQLKLLGQKFIASGANVYWLGLDENVIPPAGEPFYPKTNASYPTFGRITEIMNTMNTLGMRVIRSQTLGVSTGNPLSLMPELGKWNEKAFDTIDWTVFQARQHGLRIIVPLTDNYDYYHGGKFNFLRWRGFNISGSDNPLPPTTQEFYTNPLIISDFKKYIQKLITHKNPYTGLTYAEDPTIMAYETGNELSGPRFGDKWVPNTWTQQICQLVKKLGPQKLCVDGTYGINSTHFSIPEVDIFVDHFYPNNVTKLRDGSQQVFKANRVYNAGEIDWTGLNGGRNPGTPLKEFYDYIEKNTDSVSGSLLWSLFGRNVPDCSTFVEHNDGFTMHYNDPKNTAFNNSQISLVRQHNFALRGITVDSYLPDVACPHNYIPGYDAQYTTY